ncbi:MAG TPA: helix-turn-helix domain-containing protein [Actinomycetales bacterium]|nr:helix-turn-helix domain-containing protein [Actinomycetales bacterium]
MTLPRKTTASVSHSGNDRHEDNTSRPASQTLDRGLRTLALVADSDEPMSVAEVAAALGLHRSIAYRMLRTLEDHHLVQRDGDRGYVAGTGLAVLARRVHPTLQSAALPELTTLANDTAMTAFFVVLEQGEAVTISVVEPRHTGAHVAYRPGVRHRADRGAPGIALLAGRPAHKGERAEVTAARERGWAASHAEVYPGLRAVASPVVDGAGTCRGAVCVVFVEDMDVAPLGERVRAAAMSVAGSL